MRRALTNNQPSLNEETQGWFVTGKQRMYHVQKRVVRRDIGMRHQEHREPLEQAPADQVAGGHCFSCTTRPNDKGSLAAQAMSYRLLLRSVRNKRPQFPSYLLATTMSLQYPHPFSPHPHPSFLHPAP